MKRNMLRRAAAALLLLALACSCVQAQGAVAWGSRGNDVSRVQSKLKQYGYYSGAVDGIFGQATYDAVIWFQKKNSLKADGVVGSATAAALVGPSNFRHSLSYSSRSPYSRRERY